MYSRIISGGIYDVKGNITFVEVDISGGLPYFSMVGLLSSEVREAGERVRTAIRNSGYYISPSRITVSLSPADIRKEGTGYDLSIGIGIMIASELIVTNEGVNDFLSHTVILGELGLDGSVKGIKGVLPIVYNAKKSGYTSCIIPTENLAEALMVEGMDVYVVNNLQDSVNIISGSRDDYLRRDCESEAEEGLYTESDMCSVLGNEYTKRALMIAASGMHNILMSGQPGVGKSMLARCIRSILPEPTKSDRIEIASIYSICGLFENKSVKRPFRAPHHTVTLQAFTGGGVYPKPGELSLAHKGILFLDELPEFRGEVLESLREPLEERHINVVRNKMSCKFPADFLLVCAMNNCRCGYYPDRNMCKCSEKDVKRYLSRISGPLLDRIDICVSLSKVDIDDINSNPRGMTSLEMREIVKGVTDIQRERFLSEGITHNSMMNNEMVKKYCTLGEGEEELMKQAYEKMNLSVRSYYKILKVARTIADIEGVESITETHIAEALGYRNML